MAKNLLRKKMVASWSAMMLISVLSGVIIAQEARTWRDSTGQFSVEAVLVDYDGDQVKLKKSDGRVVTLPLTRLSEADQQYVRERQKEADNPFAGGEPEGASNNFDQAIQPAPAVMPGRSVIPIRPTAPVSRPEIVPNPAVSDNASSNASAPHGRSEDDRVRDTRVDDIAHDAQKIVPGAVTGWHYTPGIMAPDGKAEDYKPCPVTIERAGGPISDIAIVEPDGSPLAVGAKLNLGTFASTTVYFMDMKTGNSFFGDVRYKANVRGISPDGTRIMATSQDTRNRPSQSRLEFYTIEDRKLKISGSFAPYSDFTNELSRTVDWAVWISSTHILTCNFDGKLRLWEVETLKPIYEMSLVLLTHKNVELSKDRKAMIIGTHSGVAICDTMSGETLGMLTDELPQSMEFDFSPDNTRLIGVLHGQWKGNTGIDPKASVFDNRTNKVVIWDLTTGEKTGEFQPEFGGGGNRLNWVDNRMFMKNGTMYDSETGVPVCHYAGSYTETQTFRGLFCYLLNAGNNDFILTAVKLPQQAVLDAIQNVKVEDRFVLYPGVAVALVLDVDESVDADVIRTNLEKNLKDTGFVLDDSATIQVTATVKKQDSNDVNYSGGRVPRPPVPFRVPSPLGGPSVDIKITLFDSSIVITNNGEEIWKAEMTSVAPQSLRIDKDRSLQQIADDLSKPDLKFFAEIPLPRYHVGEPLQQKPSFAQFLKNVQITPNSSALINVTLTPTGVSKTTM